MAGDNVVLKLDGREKLGKGLNQLRRDGFVPAVIHDHGKQSVHVQTRSDEFIKAFNIAGKNHPVDLKVDGKEYLALIKDVNFKPPKQKLQHVVFQAIKKGEKVEAEIPVHVVGEIPAEKVGLIILHQLDTVMVQALPNNLPEELTVDGTKLVEVHDKLTVGDIVAPDGVEILTEVEHAVATVAEPRAHVEEEAEAAQADESAAAPAAEAEEQS